MPLSVASSFSPAISMASFLTLRSCTSSSAFAAASSSGRGLREDLGREEVYGRSYLAVRGKECSQVVRATSKRNLDDIGSTVRALQSRSRFPKKWLGQHYMVNESVNTEIVEAAQVEPGDLVLEIGPGTGSLTKALVDAGAHVIAVEKDADMASLVSERFQGSGQVKVVQVDFLKWPVTSEMRKLMQQDSVDSKQPKLAKVVSNLPFNITTSVIKRLLPMGDIFSRVVLLLQDEAALRLTNVAPAPVDYRPMTIVVNFFSVPEYKFKVPRKAFFPAPRVDGGVISLDLKKESEYPPVGSPKTFLSMIDGAFNGKRKMLRNSLQHMFKPSDVQAALRLNGLSETARPEELTLEEFIRFFKSVRSMSSSAPKLNVDELVPL